MLPFFLCLFLFIFSTPTTTPLFKSLLIIFQDELLGLLDNKYESGDQLISELFESKREAQERLEDVKRKVFKDLLFLFVFLFSSFLLLSFLSFLPPFVSPNKYIIGASGHKA